MDYNPKRNSMWRVVPSPAVVGGLIVAAKPRGGPLIALKQGLSGEVAPESATWTYDERTTDSGSPLIYQKHIFILQSDKNDPFSQGSKSSPGIFLLALDPATGKELGRCLVSPGGAWRASPTGADGKIYLMGEKSEVVVVSAEAAPRVLSRADYNDGKACATIAVANGCIYIRTKSKLTCIDK
jgi:outer membrane protein assembly factor BamB